MNFRPPCSASSLHREIQTRGKVSDPRGRYPIAWRLIQGEKKSVSRQPTNLSLRNDFRCAHRTMWSSLSSLSNEISRMAVLGTPSSSASSRIFLSATIWFVLMSRALYTTPYVPVVCVRSIRTPPHRVLPVSGAASRHKGRHNAQNTHLHLYIQCRRRQ